MYSVFRQMEFYSVHVGCAGRWNSTVCVPQVYTLLCQAPLHDNQTPSDPCIICLQVWLNAETLMEAEVIQRHPYGKLCASVHILANFAHLKNDVCVYVATTA